jgi:hypothetical protein
MNSTVSQEQATWTTQQVSELWEGPEDRKVNWVNFTPFVKQLLKTFSQISK